MTFTLRKETCPPVKLNNSQLPQAADAKYIGAHLNRRLTWVRHIFTKRKQLGHTLQKMYWLINKKSKVSLDNKIQLWAQLVILT